MLLCHALDCFLPIQKNQYGILDCMSHYILWIFILIANAWLPNNPFFLLHCLCSRKVKGNLFLDLNYHGDQIQSMCWRGNSTLIATTCKDKQLRVLDPRLSSVAQVCFIKCVCSAVALMVEWLRFQTLRQYFIKMVGSVLAQTTYEASQDLLSISLLAEPQGWHGL